MEQTIYVTAPFPAQLDARARIEAARRKISRAELVRLAVADYLRRLEAQAGTPARESVNERQPA